MANVQKFERAVQDDEDSLETAKKIEAQQMSEIDGDMRDVDKLKQNKGFLKSQCDKFEDEVNAARREVAGVVKEMQSANKGINQVWPLTQVFVSFFCKIYHGQINDGSTCFSFVPLSDSLVSVSDP